MKGKKGKKRQEEQKKSPKDSLIEGGSAGEGAIFWRRGAGHSVL
jgi:hypothetical protein